MVNTELLKGLKEIPINYNILNIVVNTELINRRIFGFVHYNILNIVVNTEQNVYV